MGNGCTKNDYANALFSIPTTYKSQDKTQKQTKKQSLVGKISNLKQMQGGKPVFILEIVKSSDLQQIEESIAIQDTNAFFTTATTPCHTNPSKESLHPSNTHEAIDNTKRLSSINFISPLNRISTPNFLANKPHDKSKQLVKANATEEKSEMLDESIKNVNKSINENKITNDSTPIKTDIEENDEHSNEAQAEKHSHKSEEENPLEICLPVHKEEIKSVHNADQSKKNSSTSKNEKEDIKFNNFSESIAKGKDSSLSSVISTDMISKGNKSCIIQMNNTSSNSHNESVLDTSLV
jgi:hypothetical protein